MLRSSSKSIAIRWRATFSPSSQPSNAVVSIRLEWNATGRRARGGGDFDGAATIVLMLHDLAWDRSYGKEIRSEIARLSEQLETQRATLAEWSQLAHALRDRWNDANMGDSARLSSRPVHADPGQE